MNKVFFDSNDYKRLRLGLLKTLIIYGKDRFALVPAFSQPNKNGAPKTNDWQSVKS